jgi:HAD superfamily hydrolase (TIGR01509 family)
MRCDAYARSGSWLEPTRSPYELEWLIMPIAAVLWDMDGTLVDSEQVHHAALLDALTLWDVRPEPELQQELVGLAMVQTFALLKDRYPRLPDYRRFTLTKYEAYERRAQDIRLRAGVADALDALRPRALKQAVVSNSDRILVETNLRAIGWREPDPVSISRNDVRAGKPSAEPYQRAAALLGVAPGHCLVVEDSAIGARAGLEAGMRVLAWPEPERADTNFPLGVEIADPHDLATTLLRIIGAGDGLIDPGVVALKGA